MVSKRWRASTKLGFVSGADLEVSNWVVPPKSDPYYPSMDASVGDTIIFSWPEGTIVDVHIHPTGTCDEDGAILVGYTSGSTYTFTEEDAGKELFFGCDVGRRCEAGQNIKVQVSDAIPRAQINAAEAAIDSAASRSNGILSALALTAGFAAKMIL